MLEYKRKVEELVEPVLGRHDAFLVDLQVRNDRGGKMVQLFIDTDRGITIEQCAEISRDLSRVFDDEQLFDGNYQLEVSSPGIDRPLRLLRQYHKNIGRRFRVKFTGDPEPNFMTATLVAVVDDLLTFQPEKGEAITLPFDRILESKEELPW
ncbi:MAG TPA: ribosome maturation factor RimP [Bacteroidota bacterium]|nr:ribosome maturation factor RimP [Bacteroidota bacterium]